MIPPREGRSKISVEAKSVRFQCTAKSDADDKSEFHMEYFQGPISAVPERVWDYAASGNRNLDAIAGLERIASEGVGARIEPVGSSVMDAVI
jgi:hypothetical protein